MTRETPDDLRALLTAANVTPDRPWSMYCAHEENAILQNHTFFGGHTDEEYGPCRITTGPEWDEHAAAELVEAAVNALPRLVAIEAAALEFRDAQDADTGDAGRDAERIFDAITALRAALGDSQPTNGADR